VLVADVAAASADVGATSSRLAKTDRIAEVLRAAGPDDVAVVVAWLSGELPQRQIGVGWAALKTMPPPAEQATLTVTRLDEAFTKIGALAGAGSQSARAAELARILGAATEPEQQFLRRLLGGELRQGAQRGVMADAVARAGSVPLAKVRRAAMLSGDLPSVASAALAGDALDGFRLQVGRPVGPMLAQSASGPDEALTKLGGRALFETKLDGARIQVHRNGDQVSIYTRTLDDVTSRLPEIVEAVLELPVHELVADGEVIALRPGGRPQPFQVTAARFGRTADIGAAREAMPLTPFLFDVLHVDGDDLIDAPATERLAVLDRIVPDWMRVERIVTADPAEAQQFIAATLARGHEGVLAKSPTAAYEAGRRGAGWLKIKPVHTLDLVVLAVERGSGRRTGTLSNIHLGARDPVSGGFVMLGKTFKGMTDAMLAWQTEHFLTLAVGPTDGYVIELRPEQVVEIAFDGVQRSSRYAGGMALRFARVVRYRDDKTAAQADTIDTVRAFYAAAIGE